MSKAPTLYKFRLVVRGNQNDGRRVRRVRTIDASSYELAWEHFAEHAPDMAHELHDVGYTVLPPVGWRLDGSVSTGYEVQPA